MLGCSFVGWKRKLRTLRNPSACTKVPKSDRKALTRTDWQSLQVSFKRPLTEFQRTNLPDTPRNTTASLAKVVFQFNIYMILNYRGRSK